MKLSLKMSLLSIGLSALTLLAVGAVVLRAAYRQSLDAERENARAQLSFLTTSYAVAVDREGFEPLSSFAEKNRRQYLFRRFDKGDEKWQFVYMGDTLYNDSSLALDRLMNGAGERLFAMDDRYVIVLCESLPDGSDIYLLHDCTAVIDAARRLTHTFLLIGGVAFLALAVALWLLTHAALGPLAELERAARRMAAGDYETPIRSRHRDEVGSLARSFEQMRLSVQEQIAAVSEVAEQRKLLVGALTHELKTPMTAIVGYSEALHTLRLSEEQQAESLRFLYAESKRLEALTQKMMRLIAVDGGEAIALLPVTGEALSQTLRPMLSKLAEQRGVALHLALNDFAAIGDADLLCSVLTNLFDNAVSAGASEVWLAGRGPVLVVTDNGPGMTKEVLARVTEPFYRADKARSRKTGHAGLGLALVQRIVTLHRGTLLIESEPNQGTTVTVKLREAEA